LYGFLDVWKQTFPSENDIEEVFEKRKEEAIKFKSELVNFTDEMIDEVNIFCQSKYKKIYLLNHEHR
jgi:hypothetical protein